jgi:hypothetical protein
MSDIKIGFFGETPVAEGEWIQAMGQDLFDRVRALAEDRDGWVERARRAEEERDRLRDALKRYGAHGPRCLLGVPAPAASPTW